MPLQRSSGVAILVSLRSDDVFKMFVQWITWVYDTLVFADCFFEDI